MASNINNPPAPLAKTIQGTRAGNAASGDVSYTGVGFKPSSIIFIAYTAAGGGSIGHADDTAIVPRIFYRLENGTTGFSSGACILLGDGAAGQQEGDLKTLDSDGFTLTWTLSGGGVQNITFDAICLR